MIQSPFKVSAIIPAAGSGSRFGETKQFKLFGSRPLLYYTIRPFINSQWIDEVILVVPSIDRHQVMREVVSIFPTKKVKVIDGGKLRQESVMNGIKASSNDSECVCIHDAARPFVSDSMIRDTINKCTSMDGAIVAIPARDTIKQSDGFTIQSTIDRTILWQAQTPQTFHKVKLIQAFDLAHEKNFVGTDESSIMEHAGYNIGIIKGSSRNMKITTQEDWELAIQIMVKKEQI